MVLRLALTVLLIPAALASGVLLGLIAAQSFRGLDEEWIAGGAATCCCVAYALGYWLVWRGVVAWTPRRVVRTALAAAIGAGVVIVLDATIVLSSVHSYRWLPWIMLVNGGVTAAWLIVVSVIWAETPRERLARITSAGAASSHCPGCKYDMAGLTNLTCPECGTHFTLGRFQDEHRRRVAPAGVD